MSTAKIDALYLQGKGHEDSFSFYYTNLRPLLWKYARTIGRQSLKQVEEHLIDEMVDDLLMDIAAFKGESKFSTWAYVRFRRRWIDEYRYQAKNLGSSLETLQEEWQSQSHLDEEATSPYEPFFIPTTERDTIAGEFKDQLTERQRIVLEARVDGHTFEEIGELVGVNDSSAEEIWQRVLKLAGEYGAAVPG